MESGGWFVIKTETPHILWPMTVGDLFPLLSRTGIIEAFNVGERPHKVNISNTVSDGDACESSATLKCTLTPVNAGDAVSNGDACES